QREEEEHREDTRVWMEELRALGHCREVEEEEEGHTDNFDDDEYNGENDGEYHDEYDEEYDGENAGGYDEEYTGQYNVAYNGISSNEDNRDYDGEYGIDDYEKDDDNGSRGELLRPVAPEG
ncbi:MAG: hypothetical protein Q9204_008611, partial [Flavoplaca sp. TL-2023a]